MNGVQRLLVDDELAQRIAHLKVTARSTVDGLRSGIHKSPHRGASVVFAEHREYRPGDDLRWLDWRAFARSDRYTIKHFEQEAHLRAYLLLDGSASMSYAGASTQSKHLYAATLLASLALLLLGQGDAVGALCFDERVRTRVMARSRADHLDELLRLMAPDPSVKHGTALRASLTEAAELLGRRGLIAIASDLLDADPEAMSMLGLLRARGHEVIVLHTLHPDELDFKLQERARFVDPESDAWLDTDPVAVRDAYLAEMGAFVESCRARAISAGCRYVLARTDEPPAQALARALLPREARTWV